MVKEYIVIDGENYDDALKNGLRDLELNKEDVKVEIIEEKKAFLLRKSYVKLKITPIIADEIIEIIEDSNTILKTKLPLNLDYREDGVYLTILNTKGLELSNLIDYLQKKRLKDYNEKEISLGLNQAEGLPRKIAPYQEEELIDSTLNLQISKDKLKAEISITEPIGGKILTTAEIINILNERGVTYGIDKDEINKILKNSIFEKYITIARGKDAIKGINAKIQYHFDITEENQNMTVDKYNRMDYKNLDKIRNVSENHLLIEITPATEGINGRDVYGNKITAKKGAEINIKVGKNIKVSEDGLSFYANTNGEVHFTDNQLRVDEVLTINGDVDTGTGNIEFKGKINIKGNVKSGFKVEADGDVEVIGVVEGATIISKGNIMVHRGIQGNNQAELHCSGNLNSKYMENVKVNVLGNVESEAILHSEITARGKITVDGKRGLIVGGYIRAGEQVRAKVIGSHMGTKTVIEVGIDPNEKNNYEKLKKEVLELDKNMDSSKKAVDLLNKLSKTNELTQEKQELLVKYVKLYQVLKTKYETSSQELIILTEKLQQSNNGKVHVSVITYPGVRITIGNSPKQIYDELSTSTFYVKEGEITTGPYEK